VRDDNEKELLPVVDIEGNQITTAPRDLCHDGKSMLLHPVVHFHLYNDNGQLFLQKRAMTKDLFPGKWDTSVGGHVNPSENIENALKREILEELGIKRFSCSLNFKYIWVSKHEKELVYSYSGSSDEIPEINPEEIEAGKYWSTEEIEDSLGKGILTPNFEHEFEMLKDIAGIKKIHNFEETNNSAGEETD
jgi:isopentenyldiphosphate isomerase